MKRSYPNFWTWSPTPSQEKKRSRGSKEEEERKLKKRGRHVNEKLPDECCREEKRRKEETDDGAAGPVSTRAQLLRLNPLSISTYNFFSELGEGGYGKVLLATLGEKRPYVALKYIEKTAKTKFSCLLTEAKVLKISRDCQFLCQGFAAFQTQRHAFFVMEFLSGGSLEDELEQHGPMDKERVMFHSAEMICGLQFLHSKGIIHRDIKPLNILLDHQGHVKICDFGLAERNIFPGNTTTGAAGTLLYKAPEMLDGKEYNAAVDWWSLGITIYEMATGKVPFTHRDTEEIIESILKDRPNIPLWLDKDLRQLLKKLLRKKPKHRLGLQGNIRCQPFYDSIDWVALEEGAEPPFQPRTPSENLFQPYDGKPLPFLKTQEDEAASRDINIIPGFSFLHSGWLE